jgi:hypothetical protein
LHVDVVGRLFGVTLSFGGIPSALTIPLDAVSAFVDPSIQYGLRFKVDMPDVPPEPVAEPPADKADDEPEADKRPQVVSLDAFRKRRD